MVAVAGMELGPGFAALAVLFLSLAAKLYMSFGIRIKQNSNPQYQQLSQQEGSPEFDAVTNASKAQLNVAEYEGLFIAVFLFLYLKEADGLLVTIVCIGAPLAQAIYFWGRVISGSVMPWAPLGALPRYIFMGMMIYLVGTELYGPSFENIGKESVGPGDGAWGVLIISLSAKLFMSFGIRVANKTGEFADNASKAQLNVAEYEGLFFAVLMFLYHQKASGLPVTIISYVCPLAQAIYFWGRALTGQMMPWAPLGALPRYISMGIMIYLVGAELYGSGWANIAKDQVNPGNGALGVLVISLSAKLFMSFGIRAGNKTGDWATNASKAQLNVAEYEGLFFALLIFFYIQHAEGVLFTVVRYVVPLAQGIYFWGRALTGQVSPWAPLGALPRYICMGIMIYLLYSLI